MNHSGRVNREAQIHTHSHGHTCLPAPRHPHPTYFRGHRNAHIPPSQQPGHKPGPEVRVQRVESQRVGGLSPREPVQDPPTSSPKGPQPGHLDAGNSGPICGDLAGGGDWGRVGGEGPGLRPSPRAHLSIPRPLIPPSVHLPAAHPPHPATRKGKTWPSPPRTAEDHPQLTWPEGAANSPPPNPQGGLEPQGAEPQPPARNLTWTHRHTPSETYNPQTHTHKWTPGRAHPAPQTLGWTWNPDTNTQRSWPRAHTRGGGGGDPYLGTQPTHTHLHTAPPMGARQPPDPRPEGQHSGGHTPGRPQHLGSTPGTRPDGHPGGAPHTPRRAHTGPRERTPGPPQRRGHTRTLAAHTALTPAPPPAASRAAAGRAHPARGGPGPCPAAAAALRAMVGGGPGRGRGPRGRLLPPPASRPPEPPPSSALRAARRPGPAAAAARGEGAPTGGAGGAAAPPDARPGPAADPSPLRSRRPAPDLSPAPPPALPASPETPQTTPRLAWGPRISRTETSDCVPIPRGTSDHALPPVRIQIMFYSHPGPQTVSYSPW